MLQINTADYDMSIKIKEEKDIVVARQIVKDIAKRLGFSLADITKVSTAVSELARNIYRYAKEGFILVKEKKSGEEVEIEVVALDNGPGIEDIELALKSGYTTTRNSLGLGLSGVKKLMDSFYIESEKGVGTVVIASKRRRAF